MEAAIAFFGTIATMLILLAKDVRQEIKYKQEARFILVEYLASTEEDREIYLRQEAYNRYDYTQYTGDKP